MTPTKTAVAAAKHRWVVTSEDNDIHKGATEDDRRQAGTNAPGLDADGLPNDATAIAASAVAARQDRSQG